MGCLPCCSAQKLFLFVNIGFAVYAGALLATAARLAWDPSTYTWFRWLCRLQYRVTMGYILAAGLWLVGLVYLAATSVHPKHLRALQVYLGGVVMLCLSELAYGIWMSVTMLEWWQSSPKAEMARQGMDALHDLKPVLLTLERHQELAKEVYSMIEETEREAPNNVYVIIVFLMVSLVLQVTAIIVSRRLQKGLSPTPATPPPDWRKKANLHMYSIIDKIF